jgi:hypothetical protein
MQALIEQKQLLRTSQDFRLLGDSRMRKVISRLLQSLREYREITE